MLLDISPNHLKIVQDILRKYLSAYEVWAFGSRAKWLAKEYSDLDLCVISQYPISFNILGLLEEAFNDSDLPYKVDIVDWSTTSASFREIIKKDKVVVQKIEVMNGEWINYLAIGEFAKVKGGKRMPAGTALTSKKSNHPYLRIVDFKDGTIDKKNLQYVPDDIFPRISRYVISSNDLYISIVGTIGLIGFIPKELNGSNLTENAAKICSIDERKVNPFDLGYFLQSKVGQTAIHALTVGSTQPKLALFRIEQIKVPCPPLPIQKEIAAILSSLDDRITLLRETNKTLEAIAQALFKSWFIDFDPVRAKMENKIPEGMDEETAALFPDSLEESELGMIPKGWNCVKFGDFVEPKKGQSITRKTITEGSIPVIAGGLTPAYYHNKSNVTAPAITVSASGANAGFVQIHHNDIWASDCSYINSKITKFVYANFVFLKLKQSEITNMQQGAAQPHIYPSDIKRLDVKKAPDILYEQYEKIVIKIFLSIATNKKQAQTLANLRDTLLPRLISGQIRV